MASFQECPDSPAPQSRVIKKESGSSTFSIVMSRHTIEMAERVAMFIGAKILENPHLNIGITVGVSTSWHTFIMNDVNKCSPKHTGYPRCALSCVIGFGPEGTGSIR